MKEDSTDVQTSTFLSWELKIGVILGNMADIVRYILYNLDNYELMKCREVCLLWKEIVEIIINDRIIMLTVKIPISKIENVLIQPDILYSYLEFPNKEKIQFITDCDEDTIHFPNNDTLSENCYHLIRMAIFPSPPAVLIRHFSLSYKELQDNLMKGKEIIPEIINISWEKIKCILWFVDSRSVKTACELMRKVPSCATAGIIDPCDMYESPPKKFKSKFRGIAVAGEKIKAISFTICHEKELNKNLAAKLKYYKYNKNKCVAFIFYSFLTYSDSNKILSLFKELCPGVPIIMHLNFQTFGLCNIPNYVDENLDDSSYLKTSSRVVLMWLH